MSEVSVKTLQQAIRDLHNCESEWVEAVPVKETFEGETVWEGTVQVFHLLDHPIATRCYAWSHAVDDSDRRKFYAVLHLGPVDSPLKAVQAATIEDSRS